MAKIEKLPVHISPKFFFILQRTKEQILRVYPIPYVADFNYKKFKLNGKSN